MAGWKPYLDLILKGDGVKAAAIHGQDGAKWAASAELTCTAAEIKALASGMASPNDAAGKLSGTGMTVAGVKYMFLRVGEGDVAIGRKGPTTLLVCVSKKAVIIATTKDGANPGNITSHTFVRNDLVKKGF